MKVIRPWWIQQIRLCRWAFKGIRKQQIQYTYTHTQLGPYSMFMFNKDRQQKSTYNLLNFWFLQHTITYGCVCTYGCMWACFVLLKRHMSVWLSFINTMKRIFHYATQNTLSSIRVCVCLSMGLCVAMKCLYEGDSHCTMSLAGWRGLTVRTSAMSTMLRSRLPLLPHSHLPKDTSVTHSLSCIHSLSAHPTLVRCTSAPTNLYVAMPFVANKYLICSFYLLSTSSISPLSSAYLWPCVCV